MLFISAHKPEFTKTENAKRQADLLADLLGVVGFDAKVKRTTCRYDDVEKECFVILNINEDTPQSVTEDIAIGIQELADKYDQENIWRLSLSREFFIMSYISCTWDRDDVTQFLARAFLITPKTGDYIQVGDLFYTPGKDVTWYLAGLEDIGECFE